jgi:MATE family multidrug resistance protein
MFAALFCWIMISRDAREHGAVTAPVNTVTFRALLAVGVASAVSQAAEAGAFNVMSIIAGRIGADAVAAYQILLITLAVVFMISLGFSSAGSVLVSEAVGRGDARSATRAGWLALGLNTVGMIAAGIIVLVFGKWIARGFTSDADLVLLLVALMPLCALIFLPDGGQVVMAQALRGRGDNWFPSASHIVSYVLIMPPIGFYLAERAGMGVHGLMIAIFVSSIVSIALLCARFAFLARRAGTGIQ